MRKNNIPLTIEMQKKAKDSVLISVCDKAMTLMKSRTCGTCHCELRDIEGLDSH